MWIETDAVAVDGTLDTRYTCDLDNSSPGLRWFEVPQGVTGFAMVVEDMDTPGDVMTHWLIYNIPPQIHHLPTGIPPQESLPNGILQGINSFGKLGYTGPCPPPGDPIHRYRFKLFALNGSQSLDRRLTRSELMEALRNRVIDFAETFGRYQRQLQRTG